jgi:hypothetical protein
MQDARPTAGFAASHLTINDEYQFATLLHNIIMLRARRWRAPQQSLTCPECRAKRKPHCPLQYRLAASAAPDHSIPNPCRSPHRPISVPSC